MVVNEIWKRFAIDSLLHAVCGGNAVRAKAAYRQNVIEYFGGVVDGIVILIAFDAAIFECG